MQSKKRERKSKGRSTRRRVILALLTASWEARERDGLDTEGLHQDGQLRVVAKVVGHPHGLGPLDVLLLQELHAGQVVANEGLAVRKQAKRESDQKI